MRFQKRKYVWWPGSAWTRWGSLSAPPDHLAAIGGRVLLVRGREGKGRGRGLPPPYLTYSYGPRCVCVFVCIQVFS